MHAAELVDLGAEFRPEQCVRGFANHGVTLGEAEDFFSGSGLCCVFLWEKKKPHSTVRGADVLYWDAADARRAARTLDRVNGWNVRLAGRVLRRGRLRLIDYERALSAVWGGVAGVRTSIRVCECRDRTPEQAEAEERHGAPLRLPRPWDYRRPTPARAGVMRPVGRFWHLGARAQAVVPFRPHYRHRRFTNGDFAGRRDALGQYVGAIKGWTGGVLAHPGMPPHRRQHLLPPPPRVHPRRREEIVAKVFKLRPGAGRRPAPASVAAQDKALLRQVTAPQKHDDHRVLGKRAAPAPAPARPAVRDDFAALGRQEEARQAKRARWAARAAPPAAPQEEKKEEGVEEEEEEQKMPDDVAVLLRTNLPPRWWPERVGDARFTLPGKRRSEEEEDDDDDDDDDDEDQRDGRHASTWYVEVELTFAARAADGRVVVNGLLDGSSVGAATVTQYGASRAAAIRFAKKTAVTRATVAAIRGLRATRCVEAGQRQIVLEHSDGWPEAGAEAVFLARETGTEETELGTLACAG